MITSVVDLWNLALSHVGSQARIESETETTTERIILSAVYPTARDAMLRTYEWGFANKEVEQDNG